MSIKFSRILEPGFTVGLSSKNPDVTNTVFISKREIEKLEDPEKSLETVYKRLEHLMLEYIYKRLPTKKLKRKCSSMKKLLEQDKE